MFQLEAFIHDWLLPVSCWITSRFCVAVFMKNMKGSCFQCKHFHQFIIIAEKYKYIDKIIKIIALCVMYYLM